MWETPVYEIFPYDREVWHAGLMEGVKQDQTVPFPEHLEGWIGGDNLVRAVDVLVDESSLPLWVSIAMWP